MILESVKHGPLIWPTIEENGVIRTKKYVELVSKDLWEKVQLLMQGGITSSILLKIVQDDEWSMNITKSKLETIQVNTKFLNSLPPEWSKFVIDVKLVKDLKTTNFDQLHAYLEQHELHAIEVHLIGLSTTTIYSGLAVLVFKQGDDPIDAINKMMSFLSTVVTSRFPSTNNQLRNSSNPRQQATIHDGRVTVQPLQGRQNSYAAGEGHMERQCPKPKRKRDATWFRDKVLLVEAQRNGKVLNEEESKFLADPGIAKGPVTHSVITHNATYQADALDAYDYDSRVINRLYMPKQFYGQICLVTGSMFSSSLKVTKEQLQAKDTTIKKLKANIKRLNKTPTTNSVKKDIDEIETINIELEHRVTKLIVENELLKQTYDEIKPSRVHAKEHAESLVNKLNQKRPKVPKSVQNSKPKVAKSMTANRMEPGTSWGSDTLVAPSSSSLIDCRFGDSTEVFHMGKVLTSKDEAPDFIIKFLKMIQVRLNATVRNIHTDNGTEFVNQTQQNRTLVEAARTMLIFAQAPLFLLAEAIATACYTQNRSPIRRRHGKTPYDLLHDRKPYLSYLYIFGALCYPNNNSENLGKLQAKADIGIFIGYAPKKKAYRIYNRCIRKIIETIHVDFDELTAMAFEQLGSGPGLQCLTPATLTRQ
ncbi:retrovirus-related pol polyprotein from transposon TNT 1-94 [Tanacetum coccineum]|uniref:Retrovirus-related pol polyprotein from transposon TNT 1-94 n=1 Tax=Tanacetum coccineum TaxID=301880 RepID=A0ABQ5DLD6_9ASTR